MDDSFWGLIWLVNSHYAAFYTDDANPGWNGVYTC